MRNRAGQKVIASIEARMGSSRLPGKVQADVCGKPSLSRLLERLRHCKNLDGIVLATSKAPADDVLEQWARNEDLPCFRGSENDVLDRVVGAHQMMNSDVIVEVTGDCTLLSYEWIDVGIETYFTNECDVVTNGRVRSFPLGADVQVFGRKELEWVNKNISDPAVHEHVSLYFYENPDRYKVIHLLAPAHFADHSIRLMLDYPEDLKFIREIYARLLERHPKNNFDLPEIFEVLNKNPELRNINKDCVVKNIR